MDRLIEKFFKLCGCFKNHYEECLHSFEGFFTALSKYEQKLNSNIFEPFSAPAKSALLTCLRSLKRVMGKKKSLVMGRSSYTCRFKLHTIGLI